MANVTGYLRRLWENAPDPASAEEFGEYWANAAINAPADSNAPAWAKLGVSELRFPPAQNTVILAAVDAAAASTTVADSFVLTLTLHESEPKVSFAQQKENAELLRKIKDLSEQNRLQLQESVAAEISKSLQIYEPTQELQGAPFSPGLVKTIASRTINNALADPDTTQAAATIVEYAFSQMPLSERLSVVRTQLTKIEPTPLAVEQLLFILAQVGDSTVLSMTEADTQTFRDKHLENETRKAKASAAAEKRKTLHHLDILSHSDPDRALLALLAYHKISQEDIATLDVLGNPKLVAFAIRSLREQKQLNNQCLALLVLSRALEQPTSDGYRETDIDRETLYDSVNAVTAKIGSDDEYTYYLGDLEQAGLIPRTQRPNNFNTPPFPNPPHTGRPRL